MIRSAFQRLGIQRLALIGALAAAFALAGCGRRGPLDPPPGTWITPPGAASISTNSQPGVTAPEPPPAETGPGGKPQAPPGPNRRIHADWLID